MSNIVAADASVPLHARTLCELALEMSDTLKLRPTSMTGVEAVKTWLLAQGCSPSFLATHAKSIVCLPAAKALTSPLLAPTLVGFHLDVGNAVSNEDEYSHTCTACSWPRESWQACITCLQPNAEHDPRNFLSGDEAMIRHNECSQYVQLEAALRQQLSHISSSAERLQNVPLVLYALQAATDARLRDACKMCAECVGGSPADAVTMARLTKRIYAEHMVEDEAEVARQYVAVLHDACLRPEVASLVTCNRSAWPAELTSSGVNSEEEDHRTLPPPSQAYMHEATVRSHRTIMLDHPADISAKAFAQQVGFSPLHHMDDHRFLYVVAGMRNCAPLLCAMFADEPEHTQMALDQYVLQTRGGAPLHDDMVYPNLLGAVFERPRPDLFMEREHSVLMKEVNSFVRTLNGVDTPVPSEEELPRARRIAMWLTANSRGDTATRLSQWFSVAGSAQLTNLDHYLRTTSGPSTPAMHALRSIYFAGLSVTEPSTGS